MEAEASHQSKKRSILSVLKDPTLLLPVVLTCALQGGSQLSGITAVKTTQIITNSKKKTRVDPCYRYSSIQCRSFNRPA